MANIDSDIEVEIVSEEEEVDEKATVGYVYKISSPHIDKIYIGSTTRSLRNRFSQHKSTNPTTSKIITDCRDATITLIEEVKFDNILELRQRENYYMTLNKDIIVNKQKAPTGLSKKEVKKAWYEANKNRIKARVSAEEICECGAILRHDHISSHKKTKKHYRLLAQKLKNLSI